MTPLPITIEGEPFALRLMTEADRNFVFVRWMEQQRAVIYDLYKNSPWQLRPDIWEEYYPKIVEERLDHDRTVILFRQTAPEVIHGFACGADNHVLHWASVPKALRSVGAGRAVIAATLGAYPSRIYVTSLFERMRDHPRFVYNPLIAHLGREPR